MALAVLLLALLAAAWAISRATPGWYVAAPGPRAAAMGERVENIVVSELSMARPAEGAGAYRSATWEMVILEDEANAWLATRLRGWAENRGAAWPASISGVRVAFEPGLVRVGASVVEDGASRVVSAGATPEVRDDGLWLRVSGLAVGGLPLPTGYVMSRLEPMLGAGDVGAMLAGKRAALSPPVLKMDDRRVVRVLGVTVEDGAVRVVCRTEKE